MANAYHYQNTFDDPLAQGFRNTLSLGFSPTQLPNLYAWLDGSDAGSVVKDGSVVTSWLDKSGNEKHATSSLASGPAHDDIGVHFDRKHLSWDSIDAFPEECTVFVALSFDPDYAFHHYAISDIDPTGNLSRVTLRKLSSGLLDFFANSGQSASVAEDGTPQDNKAIVTLTRNATAKLAQLYLGGELRGSDVYNAITSSQGGLAIGRSGTFISPQYFTGTIHEIIVCDADLAEEDRLKSELYLAEKWGLYHAYAPWISNYDPRVIAAIHAGRLIENQIETTASPLLGWFDSRDAATIVEVDAKISEWVSKTSQGQKLIQGFEGYRPILVDNAINGHPAIKLINDEQLFSSDIFFTTFPQEAGTLFITGEISNESQITVGRIFGSTINRNQIRLYLHTNGDLDVEYQTNVGGFVWKHTHNMNNDRRFVLRITWDTINNLGSLWINGNALSVDQAITDPAWVPDRQSFGIRGFRTDGWLAGEVLLYNEVLPTLEQERVEQALLTTWGEA